MRRWTPVAGCTLVVLFAALEAAVAVAPFAPGGAGAVPAVAPSLPAFDPIGSGSCAASACHGSARPIPGSRIFRTEHSVWIVLDKHARAYETLHAGPAAAIIRALGWDRPAYRETRCLACHSTPRGRLAGTDADAVRREGVGCEACHGPASRWVNEHASDAWLARAANEKEERGMRPIARLADRALTCAGCHVGAPPDPDQGFPDPRDVNHDMIAAGHPRLTFELADDQERMPRHWNKKAEAPDRVRAIGRIASAKAGVDLLRFRAETSEAPWPEFSGYDCASCHHALEGPSSRREALPRERAIGLPAWEPGSDPELFPLFPAFEQLRSAMEKAEPDRKLVISKALETARGLAERLAVPERETPVPEPTTTRE